MVKNEFDNFYRELNNTIDRKLTVLYPLIGIIRNVSSNREFADVETDDGIISNIPAHGFPVVGDSAIIHFINGNIEQPVCDCARRLSPTTSEIKEMVTSQCNNYLENGDFNQKEEGYTGTFSIQSDDNSFITSSNYYCELEDGEYIEFTCDISKCESKYFKFQANYRGNGVIEITCYDVDTGKVIKTQPENIAEESKMWASNEGRFGWAFNKEVYLKGDTGKVKFNITNITSEVAEYIPKKLRDGEYQEIPVSVSLDGLLVYDENGDLSYYWSEKDALNTMEQ